MPVAYAAFIPPLHKDTVEDIWVGGIFWDGRANSLEEQAIGPPLNPLEMANQDTIAIRDKLRELDYSDRFTTIFGEGALDDPSTAFANMADAIAAYERSEEFSPFDSKYDHFLRGEAELSEQELRGMGLFVSELKGNCAACHPSTVSPDGTHPLFTDFTYDNLGVPKNPENPFYILPEDLNPDGFDFIDLGLGVTVNDPAENGKFRVPTLRNIALTPPYMHNGIFKTLYQVIAFYNTRDVGPWPPPEVAENVNEEEMGDLGLTNQEIEDIAAFLMTLTDGWEPKPSD
jgi:cytochrome c peroxidase